MNKPLLRQEMWKDIWAYLQDPEANLAIFHGPADKVSIPPVNQEADVLKNYVV